MAIKTTLITTVNSFFTILVNIVKVKGALLEMINNFYPDVETVDETDTSIITLNPSLAASITYTANIYKQGRTVTMNIFLFKSTSSLLSTWLFEITNPEYLGFPVTPPSGQAFIGIASFSNNDYSGIITSDNKLNTTIDGGYKQFTITYQTLN